jgi:hypothetical protein
LLPEVAQHNPILAEKLGGLANGCQVTELAELFPTTIQGMIRRDHSRSRTRRRSYSDMGVKSDEPATTHDSRIVVWNRDLLAVRCYGAALEEGTAK